MYSWVVKTKSVTPAGLPHAGSFAKHHHLKQSTKNEGRSQNMGFDGKTI